MYGTYFSNCIFFTNDTIFLLSFIILYHSEQIISINILNVLIDRYILHNRYSKTINCFLVPRIFYIRCKIHLRWI